MPRRPPSQLASDMAALLAAGMGPGGMPDPGYYPDHAQQAMMAAAMQGRGGMPLGRAGSMGAAPPQPGMQGHEGPDNGAGRTYGSGGGAPPSGEEAAAAAAAAAVAAAGGMDGGELMLSQQHLDAIKSIWRTQQGA
jgi:hypothetical protein